MFGHRSRKLPQSGAAGQEASTLDLLKIAAVPLPRATAAFHLRDRHYPRLRPALSQPPAPQEENGDMQRMVMLFNLDRPTVWLTSHAGISLLGAVVAEAQHSEPRNRAFSRQQYIHTVAYLLHGLPQDLNQHEVTTLETSLPPALQKPIPNDGESSTKGSSDSRSFPHRVLASGIVQLFVLFHIFLPYLQLVLKSAYEYDRTHRITERALAASISAVDNVGKKGVGILGYILRSGNGRGIQILAALSVWWIKEVSSGIHEGVENCVEIAEKRKGEGVMDKRRA